MGLAAAYDHASQAMVDNMLDADAEEGILPSSRSASRSGRNR
jgi:hypothetical protein